MKTFVRLSLLGLLAIAGSFIEPGPADAQGSLGTVSSFRSSLVTPTGRTNITTEAVAKMNAASMRPIPSGPPPPVVRPDMTWVPDRYVPVFGAPQGVLVPGHWERHVSDREVHVPPLPIVHPAGGSQLIPAGIRPPADQRVEP